MEPTEKSPEAVVLGRRGGNARAENLTPAERSEAARKASVVRWARYRREQADRLVDGPRPEYDPKGE